jgi:hypothetical protein
MDINAVALSDRLAAALEGIVIGDRWVAQRGAGWAEPDGDWRQGLLRVATAASQEALVAQRWGPHFQQLTSPAAVAVNALPYLWIKADAQSHHRTVVDQWLADLGLAGAGPAASHVLFATLCQVIGTGSAGQPWQPLPAAIADPVLGPPLRIVRQSQGQLTVALALARRRGWQGASVGLVGLLVGLTGGRSSLAVSLRQLTASQAADPWTGIEGDRLESVATALYRRWAGVSAGLGAGQPGGSSPLGGQGLPWGAGVD